jgi:hypothetical protein
MSNEINRYRVISLIKFILRFDSLTMVNIKITVFWDYHVVWWIGANILEEPVISIFRVAEMSSVEKSCNKGCVGMGLRAFWWEHMLLKRGEVTQWWKGITWNGGKEGIVQEKGVEKWR